MSLHSVKEVFTKPENSSIPYLGKVINVYTEALVHILRLS